uniref:replication initiation factor domain-containing protein n=1 Tax=Cupriavidus taiwanensis TaxID=164546 RepID=UPI000E2EFEFE|nr:replication initiation factor domain-containing protein [Cupriavidus taiwanensis]
MARRVVARPNQEFLAREGRAAGAAARSDADRSVGSPRPVIRGESAKREAQTIVDWLRFTFLPAGSIGDALEQLRAYFHLWFSIPVAMVPAARGFRGYEFSHDVVAWVNGETIRLALVACGGEHVGGTMLVDMSGQGCAVVADWSAVYATMQDLDARITRCDLAMDFCQGQVSIDQVEQLYFAGDFNAGGRIPKYRRIEGGVAGAEACGGKTFEIGRRANGKLLRAYEKGRQLGKQDSEWLRIEIEFGNKDRTIEHEIVLKTDRYFAGAYKALEQFLVADPLKCATDQKQVLAIQDEIILERKLDHVLFQAGKVLSYAKGTDKYRNDAALVVRIVRKGVPAQLHKSALARHVYGGHEPPSAQRE